MSEHLCTVYQEKYMELTEQFQVISANSR